MMAIILSSGPLSTLKSFVKNSHQTLRGVRKAQYLQAAYNLQSLGIVQVLKPDYQSRLKAEVIVKKKPEHVYQILQLQANLCTPCEYVQKYNSPLPRAIPLELKEEVASMGFL